MGLALTYELLTADLMARKLRKDTWQKAYSRMQRAEAIKEKEAAIQKVAAVTTLVTAMGTTAFAAKNHTAIEAEVQRAVNVLTSLTDVDTQEVQLPELELQVAEAEATEVAKADVIETDATEVAEADVIETDVTEVAEADVIETDATEVAKADVIETDATEVAEADVIETDATEVAKADVIETDATEVAEADVIETDATEVAKADVIETDATKVAEADVIETDATEVAKADVIETDATKVAEADVIETDVTEVAEAEVTEAQPMQVPEAEGQAVQANHQLSSYTNYGVTNWFFPVSTEFLWQNAVKTGYSYSEEDLRVTAYVIYAECRGEAFEGKVMVGNTLVNRSKQKGKSIYAVATEPMQYASIQGITDSMISDEIWEAAKMSFELDLTEGALKVLAEENGFEPSYYEGGAKSFYNPEGCKEKALRDREGVRGMQSGNHIFYAK